MRKILLLITLSILSLNANELYPIWEDAKQVKYNKIVLPNSYKEDGLKEKIKEVEGEEISYFTSGISSKNIAALLSHNIDVSKGNKYVQKLKSRRFKENGSIYRRIGYIEDTAIRWSENVYFYKDKKDKKHYYKITRNYYENGSLKSEYHYLNDKYHKNKWYHKNGVLSINASENAVKEYDENSTLVRETRKGKGLQYFSKFYKNNVLIRETTRVKKRLHGFSTKYNEDGSLQSQSYYEDGNALYTSYCHFDTTSYRNQLEAKYLEPNIDKSRSDTYCLEITKDTYMVVTAYEADDQEGTKPEYLEVVLGVVNINTNKILSAYYDNNTGLGYEELFSIGRFSYKSRSHDNVIDVINEVMVGRWETQTLYNSYKVVHNKIIPLKKEIINLKDIEKQTKNGKFLTADMIVGLINEVPITKKNLTTYNNIGYYLQEHNHHTEALKMFKYILRVSPNRTVLFINIGDSAWAKMEHEVIKKSYNRYIELMKENKKENKIPIRIYERLKHIKYLESSPNK